MKKHQSGVRVSCVIVMMSAGCALAGPLTPPAGLVSPTGKTTQEIYDKVVAGAAAAEPRVAIGPMTTPGDADSVYRITAPGSYYLTGNIQSGAAGKSGIEIAVGGVTLDLNGFAVMGSVGTLNGIAVAGANRPDISVMNGSIRGWGATGLHLDGAKGPRVLNVSASANSGWGMIVGEAGIVSECTAIDNSNTGFLIRSAASVRGCTARSNGDSGFQMDYASTITNCSAYGNGGDGIRISGATTITQCSSQSNGESGYVLGVGGMISDSAALANHRNGIQLYAGAVARNNLCKSNGAELAGSGIRVESTEPDCRIEGNTCIGNFTGLSVLSSGNFVARNTCSGSTLINWNVATGNKCLVVNGVNAGAFSGNSGGSSPGSTDPNANYTY